MRRTGSGWAGAVRRSGWLCFAYRTPVVARKKRPDAAGRSTGLYLIQVRRAGQLQPARSVNEICWTQAVLRGRLLSAHALPPGAPGLRRVADLATALHGDHDPLCLCVAADVLVMLAER